jgi:hypothetical protein
MEKGASGGIGTAGEEKEEGRKCNRYVWALAKERQGTRACSPNDGQESAWPRQRAAHLLCLALLQMTDEDNPPDMHAAAAKSGTSDVHALMLAA